MNYLQINEFCRSFLPDLSGAELAGMLHGLVGHGFVPEAGRWPQQMSDFLANGEPLGKQAEDDLEQIIAFTQKDYQPESFTIELLIPEDDSPIDQRAQALGEWCQGYLTGYGLIKQEKELDDAAQEALRDMSEIAKIDFSIEDDNSEELESAFMTISEHVKMSAQIIFQSNKAVPMAPQNKKIH
ncbi:MAG: UPF0149 family protein [Kangiella sp.]|jgi:uncharacterized protein YgfB (UPF0149 family)|nr:UPF0149 family protein [Kangiella sp.]MCW9029835.1 UPF0149 family protein [Kangiella sp.]